MNFFEKLLRDLIIAGEVVGPIFIHSAHGVAILNGTEEGLTAILQANQQHAGSPPPPSPPSS